MSDHTTVWTYIRSSIGIRTVDSIIQWFKTRDHYGLKVLFIRFIQFQSHNIRIIIRYLYSFYM
jgi:hypothetical protein